MNQILSNLERKFGRYAVPGLTRFVIASYCIGYILEFMGLTGFINLNPNLILRGQVWRLVTWVLMPPSSFDIFTIIMLLFYYQIGMALENTWGSFRYNVYILSGVLFTIVGAFLAYMAAVMGNAQLMENSALFGQYIAQFVTTYYVSMTIFFAFAASYPDMQVMFYFIIPLKIKWLAILDGVFVAYSIIRSPWFLRIIILMSLLNFALFFLSSRNISPGDFKRRQNFRRATNEADRSRFTVHRGGKANVITKHKCAICGRTEVSDPGMEFRFCSKCNGNYEYCGDHLYTHMHIQ